MPWNSLQFMQQFNQCGNRYESENVWFGKQNWGDQHHYTLTAWRLYQKAATNKIPMLILGSAKIRKDPSLLSNFGVTSAGGLSDPEELKLVDALEQRRNAARTAPALKDAPKVLGSGSILNDKNWTPLLNDSFILGGVHGNREFHLAEDDAGKYFDFLAVRDKFERTPKPQDAKDKWMGFFRAHPELLWAKPGVPRILARELIGLKTFGYRPAFFTQQLSFYSDQAANANFVSYLRAVEAAGFRSGDANRVLTAISEFLFDRPDAFRGERKPPQRAAAPKG
jgi:hypothetical protein